MRRTGAACFLLIGLLGASPALGEKDEGILLVAHHGASVLADENTLHAFELAADAGMDYIECDPRRTADGAFVLVHDKKLDRTTDGTGRVSDRTLEEIRALRTVSGEMIPTLEEGLELARERDLGVLLDLRDKRIDALTDLLEVVDGAQMAGRVILRVPVPVQKWMEKNRPEIETMLSWPLPVTWMRHVWGLGAEWVEMPPSLATPHALGRASSYGLRVMTGPLNDPDLIQEKLDAGYTVIRTNDPGLVAGLRD